MLTLWIERNALCLVVVFLMVCGVSIPAISSNVAGTSSRIQHLIFIIQENHSFDNYFGTYPGANGFPHGTAIPADLNHTILGIDRPFHLSVSQPVLIVGDELPPGVSDPSQLETDATGTVGPFPFDNESTGRDLSHSWAVAHFDYDGGKMDGFLAGEKNILTMGYYDRNDIPYYWDYADKYWMITSFLLLWAPASLTTSISPLGPLGRRMG